MLALPLLRLHINLVVFYHVLQLVHTSIVFIIRIELIRQRLNLRPKDHDLRLEPIILEDLVKGVGCATHARLWLRLRHHVLADVAVVRMTVHVSGAGAVVDRWQIGLATVAAGESHLEHLQIPILGLLLFCWVETH